MDVVTVSPKYQIVIPKAIREEMKIKPGQKIQAFASEDRIELVPLRSMKSMRGFMKGIDRDVEREEDRV